jgi:hypothetical protein
MARTINAFGGTAPLNSVIEVGTFMLPSIDVPGTAVAVGAV